MLTLIMEDEQCFVISWTEERLNFAQQHDISLQQALFDSKKRTPLALALAPYRQQTLLVGLPPSCYGAMLLSLPTELSVKDIQAFCQIKLAKLLHLPQGMCQVSYYQIQERTFYVIGCSQSLLDGLQQLARHLHLQLRVIDLTIYGILTLVWQQSQRDAANLWIMPQAEQWQVFQQEGAIILPWQNQEKFSVAKVSPSDVLQQAQVALNVNPQNCFYLNTKERVPNEFPYQVIDISSLCGTFCEKQNIKGCEWALLAAKGLCLRHEGKSS